MNDISLGEREGERGTKERRGKVIKNAADDDALEGEREIIRKMGRE